MYYIKSSFHREKYGEFDDDCIPAQCAKQIGKGKRIHVTMQCPKPRGYGPEEAFCAKHASELGRQI